MLAEQSGDFSSGAFIVNGELGRGAMAWGPIQPGIGEFDAAPFDGEVKVVGSGSGVSARLGVGTGRHVGDAKRNEGIAEGGRLTG